MYSLHWDWMGEDIISLSLSKIHHPPKLLKDGAKYLRRNSNALQVFEMSRKLWY